MENEKTEDITSENETTNIENNENSGSEIDWEKRALKAEAKIIKLKQEKKAVSDNGEKEESSEEDTEQEESKKDNNEVVDEVVELKKQLEEMKAILEEKTVENNIASSEEMSIQGDQTMTEGNEYTKEELAAMSQEEYNKAVDRISRGEASVV